MCVCMCVCVCVYKLYSANFGKSLIYTMKSNGLRDELCGTLEITAVSEE